MKRALFLDADDTLWDEQAMLQGFEKAVEATLDKALGRPSNFSKTFIDLENGNIPHIGYGFPSYMFSAGEAIASNPEWHKHKDSLLDSVREVIKRFTLHGPQLIEGVKETLGTLRDDGLDLYVLTRGVEFEQLYKLEKSGLKDFFRGVYVVPIKNDETYLTIGRDPSFLQTAFCMAGNSVKADVNPAVRAGWRGVHIPAPTVWGHDEAELADSPRAYRVDRIAELPKLTRKEGFWR
jgi:putative hydrolase of the HAD superfamily